MSLDINNAMEMLEKSFGESASKIYIPSLEKEVDFKPLTVGMQKSISKMSLDFDTDIDYQLLKFSILKTLCMDETIDFNKLSEIDFTSILAQLRINNYTEQLKLIVSCNNCSKQFNIDVNMEQIIDNCKKYEIKTIEITKKKTIKEEEMKFKFQLSESTIMSNIEYLNYLEFIGKDETSVVNYDNSRLLAYPLKFIENIYINGQQIVKEDNGKTLTFREFSIQEKINFIDNLPPSVYSESKTGVLQKVLNTYPHQRITNLFPEVKCPYCKKVMEGVLTNDSFFII